MPRIKRIIPCNSALHAICRGNNKINVFHTDNDKLRYYTLLNELKYENKIDVLHYCLMDNHVHLILNLNPESKLSKFMKQVQCGKYIELNPVRAKMVSYPAEYHFSSHNFYTKGKLDSLITPSPAFLGLSDSAASRQKQYIDFVVDSSIINSGELEKKLYIGSQAFISKLQEYYQIKNRRNNRGRPPKAIK